MEEQRPRRDVRRRVRRLSADFLRIEMASVDALAGISAHSGALDPRHSASHWSARGAARGGQPRDRSGTIVAGGVYRLPVLGFY